MGADFMRTAVPISVVLLPPVVVSAGLGAFCLLAIEDSVQISGEYTSYSSVEAIAAALTATELSAAAAADLTAALSQTNSPGTVWVATYDSATEDPTDAADRIIAAGVDVGVFSLESRTNTNIGLLGTWLASGDRRWRYVADCQSAEATLLTGSPSSALDAYQVSSAHLHYAADAQPQAAAHGGRIAGANLAAKPLPSRLQLLTVALPTVTEAQQVFAEANNVDLLYALDKGASASERLTFGRTNYDGTSFKAVVTTIYTVRRCVAALQAMVIRAAINGDAIAADASGAALVTAVLNEPLSALAAVGHYSPGTSGSGASAVDLPDGYSVSVAVVDDDLVASIVIRLAREVHEFQLNVTGEVI